MPSMPPWRRGLALAVTLPRAGNLGGGGFMLVHLAKQKKTIAIDYREAAPAAMTPESFLDAKGDAVPRLSRDTGLAVGVPGTVAGFALALRTNTGPANSRSPISIRAGGNACPRRIRRGRGPRRLPAAGHAASNAGRRAWRSSCMRTPRRSSVARGSCRRTLRPPSTRSDARRRQGDSTEGPIAERIIAAVKASGGVMTLGRSQGLSGRSNAPPVIGTYRGHT